MIPLSIPYSDDAPQYVWGPPMANFNFCEEDSIITPYIVEFINTLSNITYTDSLSMLLATSFVLHRVMTFDKPPAYRKKLGLFTALSLLSFSLYHSVYNDMTSHSVVFGVMIFVVGVKTMALVEAIRDGKVRRNVRRLARLGAGEPSCFPEDLYLEKPPVFGLLLKVSFGGGFALWLVDIFACGRLLSMRRRIGMPWGFLLELHGWWHILTGIGSYIFIVLVEFLTSDDGHDTSSEMYAWPVTIFLGRGAGKSVKVAKTG
ncbi:hypothetical protein MMC08_003670 [Hypocenomyce scalaris]|nr:hypothetical protein [Hypocenomyce scalaris]